MAQPFETGQSLEAQWLETLRARYIGHMVRLVQAGGREHTFVVARVSRIRVPATVMFALNAYWVALDTQIYDLGKVA